MYLPSYGSRRRCQHRGGACVPVKCGYIRSLKNLIAERTREALKQIKSTVGISAHPSSDGSIQMTEGSLKQVPIHDELRTVNECVALRGLGFATSRSPINSTQDPLEEAANGISNPLLLYKRPKTRNLNNTCSM